MSTRFSELAKRAFSFLEEAGYRLTRTELAEVQYESHKAFVVVTWDPRSGELDALVGLLPRSGTAIDEYSLADVMAADGVPASDCEITQVSEEERLGSSLEQLAAKLRTHALPALAGDRMYFRRLETFRSARAAAFMREMKLRKVRSEAEEAWRHRQLDRVVALFASVESDLSESEARKLDYARRHQAR